MALESPSSIRLQPSSRNQASTSCASPRRTVRSRSSSESALTNARKQSISGRHFGRLEPTFNATFPADAPPGGQWLVLGNVCIERASAGQIEDDCEQQRYQPARGITNLTSGDATIFLDQTIGIRDRE